MNSWLVFGSILLLALLPCLWLCLTGATMERFLGLQMGQILAILLLLTIAEGYQRDIYYDIALVLSVLSFASALVYVRFLERWL